MMLEKRDLRFRNIGKFYHCPRCEQREYAIILLARRWVEIPIFTNVKKAGHSEAQAPKVNRPKLIERLVAVCFFERLQCSPRIVLKDFDIPNQDGDGCRTSGDKNNLAVPICHVWIAQAPKMCHEPVVLDDGVLCVTNPGRLGNFAFGHAKFYGQHAT